MTHTGSHKAIVWPAMLENS